MNYNSKYKERKPEETVKIIKDFFTSRGIKTRCAITESTFGSYSTVCWGYMGKLAIIHSNGKGTSPAFAMASGYAELYERYCAFFNCDFDLLLSRKTVMFRDKAVLFKGAVEQDFESTRTQPVARTFLRGDKWTVPEQKKILDNFLEGEYIGLPYTNVVTGEVKMLNNRLIDMVHGSNGLAAGNSFEEAFNQGMSELCEREVLTKYWLDPFEVFYCIPNDKITDPLLSGLIKNIENDFKKLYIFDCSYYFKTPVVMIYFVDELAGRVQNSFGCFPVFNIALERCITEVNQNVRFSEGLEYTERQKPWRCLTKDDRYKMRANGSVCTVFYHREDFLEHIKYVDGPSEYYYHSEVQDNKEIFEFWRNYLRENNIDVFYREFSLLNNMSALRLYSEHYISLYLDSNKAVFCDGDLNRFDIIVERNRSALNHLVGDYDFEGFFKDFEFLSTIDKLTFAKITNTFFRGVSIFSFYELKTSPMELKEIIMRIKNEGNYLSDEHEKLNAIEDALLKYATLTRYAFCKLYSNEEIKNFGKIIGFDWTDEDIAHYNDYKYLVKKCLYDNVWDIYHSLNYTLAAGGCCIHENDWEKEKQKIIEEFKEPEKHI